MPHTTVHPSVLAERISSLDFPATVVHRSFELDTVDINLKVREREREREREGEGKGKRNSVFYVHWDFRFERGGSRGKEGDLRRDRFVFGDLYIRGLLLCGRFLDGS